MQGFYSPPDAFYDDNQRRKPLLTELSQAKREEKVRLVWVSYSCQGLQRRGKI